MRVGFAASLLLIAGAVGATTIVRQGVPELSRRADAVVRGTVLRTESRWSGDRRTIFTESEIEVVETLKGSARKTVRVRQPGGVVGKIGQRVDGVASFRQGEEVVVFLARRPDDSFTVQGMGQGKFRVERSSDGKGAFAVPQPIHARVIDPADSQGAALEASIRPLTLEELRVEIRNALAVAPPAPTPLPTQPPPPTREAR